MPWITDGKGGRKFVKNIVTDSPQGWYTDSNQNDQASYDAENKGKNPGSMFPTTDPTQADKDWAKSTKDAKDYIEKTLGGTLDLPGGASMLPGDKSQEKKEWNALKYGASAAYSPDYTGLWNRNNAKSAQRFGDISKIFGKEYEGFGGQPELTSYLKAQNPAIEAEREDANKLSQSQILDKQKLIAVLQSIIGPDVQNENSIFHARNFGGTDTSPNAAQYGGAGAQILTALFAKGSFVCVPGYLKIDVPNGWRYIQDVHVGDTVIDADGLKTTVKMKHEYSENPTQDRFINLRFNDGVEVVLCDNHRIKGVRAQDYNVGDVVDGKIIVSKHFVYHDGVSFDILTDSGTYRSNGIPIDTMIVELSLRIARDILISDQEVVESSKE